MILKNMMGLNGLRKNIGLGTKMYRSPHTACAKGTRVKIVLRNGSEVIGKFVDRKSKYVVLDCGRYDKNTIRSFAIYKEIILK